MSIFESKYNQGTFIPVNKDKCFNYNGQFPNAKPIKFRSSWELDFCNFCDKNENILAYGSEVLVLPYYSELDNKTHKYVTDFILVTKDKHTGEITKWVIEIKPENQVARLDENGNIIMPPPPKKQTPSKLMRWQERCNVIRRNNEKWTAARDYCYQKGYKFKVMTESSLGLK